MEHSLFAMLILSMAIVSFGIKINVVHKWRYCEYEWESKQQKKDAINSGIYDPYTCVLIDADKAKDGRIFVTAPRELGPGTPATVATVTNKTGPGGPLLRPYPDWSWHNNSCICDGIVNVYRLHIQCNYIVLLDNGKIGSDLICNPKLLIFNLEDDTLVKIIYIPLDIATNRTGAGYLITPIVYYPKTCKRFLDEMIVFMADSQGSGLIVYDSCTKRMCRVESDSMKSADVIFSVVGENFTYTGGILSLTVLGSDLYYASLSGNEIYKIKIKTLLGCPNKEEANKESKFVKLVAKPILPMAAVENAIFYSDVQGTSLLGTNVEKSGENTAIISQDSKKLQIISGLKYSSYWDQLTYISDRYQRFVLGTVNLDEIHFRYIEMDITDIREKTDLFSKQSY
ncbi:PREDICTED: major royal jelly protein 2-like [Cyphomyrmex costatus]|uniref:major royal jelly protein 2-like n=1 Tax=Cyphomyrmex costatus TaxID=456900 RepID=UPI0008522B68|nr:PREDICTED: major royal jelly protein 2-like [Cyphomyrmex costatus]